jgi:hypothetical protein
MRINDERPHCPPRTSTHSRIFRSDVRAACQAAVVGRSLSLTLPQPSRFAGTSTPSRRLTLPSTGARRPLCLMSRVSRGLAQPFLTAQPIEFRYHTIAKIYPIDRCPVPMTPIATILLHPTNGALGHLLTYKATGRNSFLAMLAGETRPDGK